MKDYKFVKSLYSKNMKEKIILIELAL